MYINFTKISKLSNNEKRDNTQRRNREVITSERFLEIKSRGELKPGYQRCSEPHSNFNVTYKLIIHPRTVMVNNPVQYHFHLEIENRCQGA